MLVVLARSTFPSQKCQRLTGEHLWTLRCCKSAPSRNEAHAEVKMHNTPASEHFWKLTCRKSAHHCGAKHVSKLKVHKHHMLGPFLKVQMLRGGRKQFRCLPKVSKSGWFSSMSKNDGRGGAFQEDLQRCISRGRRSTRNMFIGDVRGSER